jgi:hypothetical protein
MQAIKIQCDCGQKIAFDVEPLNGQMPYALQCPACNRDITAQANEVLWTQSGQPRLRINPGPATPVAPEPEISAAPGVQRTRYAPAPAAAVNVQSGTLGAIAGALVGFGLWYMVFKSVDHHLDLIRGPNNSPFMIALVGLLAGLGGWILGRGGDAAIGKAAAMSTFLVIAGGQFLIVRAVVHIVWGPDNPFIKVNYWKAYGTSFSIATIIFGLIGIALAYVAGSGLLVKILPKR